MLKAELVGVPSTGGGCTSASYLQLTHLNQVEGREGGVVSPFMVTKVAMVLFGPLPMDVAALSMMSYELPPARPASM